MKIRSLILSIAFTAGSALVAASAPAATMVAGWDFSQYLGDGILSVDAATFTNTLSANYSDLQAPGGGSTSAAFGSLYMNGANGSSFVDAGAGTEQILPTAGSLNSNSTVPVLAGDFDNLGLLAANGQMLTNTLSMIANQAVSIVFEADLSSINSLGNDWELSFGGKTFSGTTSIGIEFSTDGVNFGAIGTANLTTTDTPFSFSLGTLSGAGVDHAFVRLAFATPNGPDQGIIDNVALSAGTISAVPEPAAAALLAIGLFGLARAGRIRRA